MLTMLKKILSPNELINAVKKHDEASVQKLLQTKYKNSPSLDTEQEEDYNALAWATLGDNEKIIRCLVNAGADINYRNNNGETALNIAVSVNNSNSVSSLLSLKADPNIPNTNGCSPLMTAIKAGYGLLSNMLIEYRARINQCDLEGRTAFLYATQYDQQILAVSLLLQKADPTQVTQSGRTALFDCAETGDAVLTQVLLTHGLKPNHADLLGFTPMHIAVANGNILVVARLIRDGGNINCVRSNGWTPLMDAIVAEHEELSLLLLSMGANVNAESDTASTFENTPIVLAVARGNVNLVRMCLAYGADTSYATQYGSLIEYSQYTSEHIGKLLAEYNESPIITQQLLRNEFENNASTLKDNLRKSNDTLIDKAKELINQTANLMASSAKKSRSNLVKSIQPETSAKSLPKPSSPQQDVPAKSINKEETEIDTTNSCYATLANHHEIADDLGVTLAHLLTDDDLSKLADGIYSGDSDMRKTLAKYFQNCDGIIPKVKLEEQTKFVFERVSSFHEKNNRNVQSYLGSCYLVGKGVDKDISKAINLLQKAAAGGEPYAMTALGYCYSSGTGVPKSIDYTISWYESAIKQCDFASAFLRLGFVYFYGNGVQKDHVKALENFESAYSRGDHYSSVYICNIITKNYTVNNELPKVINILSNSAKHGDPGARFQLGLLYRKGLGVTQSDTMAVKWFFMAAQGNHAKALYNLGSHYEQGKGVPADKTKAFEYYEKAANHGFIGAYDKLYKMLSKGLGVSKNDIEAFNWALKGEKKNHPFSTYNCACCYLYGNGVDKDVNKGLEYLNKAIDLDVDGAKVTLAKLLIEGEIIEKNVSRATAILDACIKKNNNPAAHFYMSELLLVENANENNIKKGLEHLQISANGGNTKAQAKIPLIYTQGKIADKNIPLARKYLSRAIELNPTSIGIRTLALLEFTYAEKNEDYQKLIKLLHQIPNDEMKANDRFRLGACHYYLEEYDEAVKWLTPLADANHVEAAYKLGALYLKSEYSGNNAAKAHQYLLLAANANHHQAQLLLATILAGGINIARNIPESIHWCLRAEEKLPGSASELLSSIEDLGHGTLITEQQQKLSLQKNHSPKPHSDPKLIAKQVPDSHNNNTSLSQSARIKSKTNEDSPKVSETNKDKVIDNTYLIDSNSLRKIRSLGQGAYGEVYYGKWHEHTDVAIKQLKLNNLPTQIKQSFESEVSIMAQLHSPYIVRLYGVCEDNQPTLILEYMEKGSLFNYLHSEHSLNWASQITISIDIATGLDFLHLQKPEIIHRDLKSLNVLLDDRLRAKIADFGLATVKKVINSTSKREASSKNAVGTLPWMAPELFNRKPTYSKASDIYAYGTVLWEILSPNKVPFEDAADPALIANWIANGEREDIPPNTNEKFADLIKRCWAHRAENRPSAKESIKILKTLESTDDSADCQRSSSTISENNDQPTYASGKYDSAPSYA